ncbi:MAG: LysM peptidoglycan-binding domain-containing protein [Phycisphaerales bacterium]
MTRENKLALVVGFGLVLFVGILVSDHYSAINRKPGADLHDPNAVAQAQPVRKIDDITRRPPIAMGTPAAPVAPEPTVVARDPGAIAPDGSRGVHVPAGPSDPRPEDVVANGRGSSSGPAGGIVDPLRSAPIHVVKKGETLYGIAREQLGNGDRWKEILEVNKLKDARALAEGMKLTMPATVSVQAPEALAKPVVAMNDRAGGVGARADDAKVREHTVKDGETLSSIAQKLLGTTSRWQELYQLNKDRIKNPDDVSPGTVLKLPEPATNKPRGAARA